jgi:hypothetical protein
VPEFIVGTLSLSATVAQGLYRYIQTDLVSIFEAVRNRFGRVENANEYAFNGMLFHTSLKSPCGEANEA